MIQLKENPRTTTLQSRQGRKIIARYGDESQQRRDEEQVPGKLRKNPFLAAAGQRAAQAERL
jgi:hypothetical protein